LNSQSPAISPGNVTLLRLSLSRQQDLVWLRRETRAAAEQCGMDDRSVRSLSAASYEAARLLFGETQPATAEISITGAGELQVGIQIATMPPDEREAVGRAVRTSMITASVVVLFVSLAIYGQTGHFNLAG